MLIETSRLTFNCAIDGPDDAPPVVFSNSLGASLAMWQPQVDALAREFRVIRYDQRGHGASGLPPGPYEFPALVDDVIALLDALGLQRVHFVGLSMGGMTALGLALAQPARLRSITAANCVARMGPAVHAVWDERARIAREQGMAPLVAPSLERWFKADTRQSRSAELAWAGEMLAATPVAGYAAACGALKTMDYLDALPAITVPTLFIAGVHDAGAPLEAMREMHARVPGSKLVELDAAHVSNLERPAAFTAALRDFLREHPR
jgi:3-oxoadipate enol-lactonase